MRNISVVLSDVLVKIIMMLGIVLVSYLLLLAGFSTALVDIEQKTYMVYDNMWINCFWAALVFGIALLLTYIFSRKELSYRAYLIISVVLTLVIFGIGVALALALHVNPLADEQFVCDCATQWINGDYSTFDKGTYLDIYPHQQGLVLFIYFLWKITGVNNYLAFQIINAFFVAVIYKTLSDIIYIEQGKKSVSVFVLVIGIVFLPLFLFVTFIYGNIIGTALALLAYKWTFVFEKKKTILPIILSIVYAILAIIIKQNASIMVLALIIYEILLCLKGNKICIKRFIIMAGLALAILCSSKIAEGATTLITGSHANGGVSKWAWVAMGMQDQPERKWNGWYNGYNRDTYVDSGYDTAVQEKVVVANIKERITYFKENPKEAIAFFAGKNASQWNNPTFCGIWSNQFMLRYASNDDSSLKLLDVPFVDRLSRILNIVQFLILACTLTCLVQNKNRLYSVTLFILAILGGFIFHTIWEAEAVYTIWYFILFIPLASIGLITAAEKVNTSISARRFKADKRSIIFGVLLLMVALIIQLSSNTFLICNTIKLNDGTDSYRAYIKHNTYISSLEGKYNLVTSGYNNGIVIVGEEYDAYKVALEDIVTEIEIVPSSDNYVYLKFSDDTALEVPENSDWIGQRVQVNTFTGADGQKWYLCGTNVDEIAIVSYNNRLALTYDLETGTLWLDEFVDASAQNWGVVPAKSVN